MRSEDGMFVNRCLDGDWAAFAFLMGRYKEIMHAYAYHRVDDYQAAQDITQEVFIKAYGKLGQLKWPHKFRSWLYTIASNECKMWLRTHSKEREREVSWEDVPVEKLDELAVRNHSDEDIRLTVKSAMETLPDANQLALSLYYMSDLSVREVAEFLGISPNNVKVRLHRARKQLGERLEKMIGKQLKKEKLRSGFAMTMMNSIRNMPIPSLPKPRPIKWAPIPISIGAALLIGVIGFGISSGGDVRQDTPVLKPMETQYEVSLLPDLDSYPEQAGAVKEAVIRKEDKGFNIRQLWADADIGVSKTGALGAISPDGRYISHVDWETGDLAIRENETGMTRRLTNEGSIYESGALAFHSRWSPDSKQVVYDWLGEDFVDIRIVGIDGGKPRILYRKDEDESIQTYDWSPDGKHILALSSHRIVTVSVADGSMRVLRTLAQQDEENCPTKICFSPDGLYIAYDYPSKEYFPNRDIFLLSADGSREIPLIKHPADDFLFGWTPDGKHILFASNRTGTLSFWLIQISEGKPQGTPELVKSDMGPISPLGLSQKGSFYYLVYWNKRNIYVVELDPGTGKILTQPKIAIKRFEGSNSKPYYSPDGKSLAYISIRSPFSLFRAGTTPGRNVLCIRSLETAKEREILTKLNIDGPPKWSPDGNSILVLGSYNDTRRGLYKIDAQTGDVTPVVVGETIHASCEWSRDGKAIFFVRNERELCQIMVRDLESGEEKELHRENFPERFAISLSPDGQWLAFLNNRSAKRVLRVIPAAGGEPRELYTWELSGAYIWHTWTADGRYILVPIHPPIKDLEGKVENIKWSLWRIPVEDGKPQKLGLEMQPTPFSVHPDGRHIAFSSTDSTDKSGGVWLMENFLPGFTAGR